MFCSRHESSGRRRSSSLPSSRACAASAAIALAIFLSGCVEGPLPAPVRRTGDPIVDGNAELAAAPAKDRVLWDYRIAASALRAGQYDEAKAKLDDAITRMGGIIANDESAKKARSLFANESDKTFIGEPYERAMAFYYRGLLYWRDGEPDNARACFRSAQYIDGAAVQENYRGDYVLFDYLDGLASTKLSDDGSDAFARAQTLAKHDLPAYEKDANVLCFVEFGRGPQKYAAGQYGEQLKFRAQQSRIHSARLIVGDQTANFTPWDNLSYQAITRGNRVMDYILGNKAVFKQGAEAVGDLALVGAAIAADNIYKEPRRLPPQVGPDGRLIPQRPEVEKNYDAENAAIALGVIGLIGKVAASATTPRADTRAWENLPQYLSFSALKLPAGAYPATLQFVDAQGEPVADLTRRFTLNVTDPAHDTVVILSELKR
jgi:tetratricopeptide (TPR) repeat protein